MGQFEDKQFQAVIDKAAMDAVYCAELGSKKVKKALDEFDRVLVCPVYVRVCACAGQRGGPLES